MFEELGFRFNLETLRVIFDVLIVSYLIYRGLLITRGTRAAPMLMGLSIIVLLYFISREFGLLTLGWVLGHFLSSIILVVVVIFQDEIRRGLTKFGLQPVFRRNSKGLYDRTVEDLSILCARMSEEKLGALIVMQRDVGLEDYVEESITVDAELNRKLLYSIFIKESPLHDGAVVVDGDRIRAAGCVLPLTFNPDLDPTLGTRHRAALGISEVSDAVVVIVSEETGSISIARDGKLNRNIDPLQLRDTLTRALKDRPLAPAATAELGTA